MFRAFKVELKTNNKQESMLYQALGNARFSYNWALEIKKKAFESKTKIPNNIELHRQINTLKKTDYPFLYLASKTCVQNALRDCDKAFQNFFTRCKKKVKGKKGFPKFKSKKNEKQSFRLDGAISVESDCIKLPRIGYLSDRSKVKMQKFSEDFDLQILHWDDLVVDCCLPFKSYSSFFKKAKTLNIEIEDFLARQIYKKIK